MSWPMVKLRKLVVANYGKALKKEVRDENGDIEVFGSAGLVGFHNESLFEQQTIVIGRKGSVGKVIWAPKGGWVIDTAYYLTVKENVVLDWRYLFYVLQNVRLDSKTITTSIPGLNRDDFYDTEIPLPPIEQQKRIAAILDKADAIRQKRKQAIALADEFLRSVFLDMFGDPVTNPKGWSRKEIKEGVSRITSGWSAKGDSRPCGQGEVGVLKISAVTSGEFKPKENKFVEKHIIPEGKNLIFPKKGDLLFSRANTRELVAATCIVPKDCDDVFLPDKLWNIELSSEELMPEYFHMLLQDDKFKETLTSQATGSSGSMLNISKQKFETTLAPFAPIDLQMKFKNIYWQLKDNAAKMKNSEDYLIEQFNALSQKAFSGQL
ncbi:restriction endonuclease subunit S [Vibrio cholerae]|uniref:restriction endonuclease subunit S n=1 Tax=Vibrio cholerae TaxID=666 RepID=UPI002B28793F|nr:restriction endonuclease subunit S [Vibrio cholerae]BER94651.1 restriction endonuclease subunit S [Vibrio cholerae]